MTTIFDLDYTLLNTRSFKNKLAEIIGMEAEDYDKSYKKNFKDKKLNYTLKEHLDVLKQEGFIRGEIQVHSIQARFENEMKDLDSFLFDGALELILNEKTKGNKLVLLTFGNESWQREKINKLGIIKDLFDVIKYEEIDKSNSPYLEELGLLTEEYTIINDNIGETKKMAEILRGKNIQSMNKVNGVIIEGPYSKESDLGESGFRYCKNLKELLIQENESAREQTEQHIFRIK